MNWQLLYAREMAADKNAGALRFEAANPRRARIIRHPDYKYKQPILPQPKLAKPGQLRARQLGRYGNLERTRRICR